jgi:YwiC-like protein
MAHESKLTAEQKTWVTYVSNTLGGKTRIHLGEIRVSFREPEQPAESVHQTRSRALIVPREHGAWGLLLVPMITGAGLALLNSKDSRNIVPFLLLLASALTLFWLRTPFESLLGTSAMRAQTKDERRTVIFAIAILTSIATVGLGTLLWAGRNANLWWIGAAAGAAFAGQALLKKLGRSTRMLSQIVGTIGLTASAPAAYYVITGKFDATAWTLWIVNLVFAGNQIHYVQLRLHTARIEGLRARLSHGWAFAAGQLLLTAALTVACGGGVLPQFASLAFAPLLFRGWFYFIQKPAPLAVRKLGWSELAQAAAFCVLLVATFSIPN